MKTIALRAVLATAFFALFALLVGCAPQPIGKPVVWPDPPDPPRIRFVTAFRQTMDLDNSGWSRFWRSLLGGGDDQGLGQPMSVAISDDDRRLYIADFSMGHVFLADFDAHKMRFFAPDESMGKPFGVALDGKENVYVSDSVGKVVHVYNSKGEPTLIIGRDQLERPTGVAIDRARGRLYVSDSSVRTSTNHRVRAFSLDGKFLFDLGPRDGKGGKGDDDGFFYFPTYLVIDASGNVYVADSMNFRIQVFDTQGKFLRKYGEHGDAPGDFSRIKGLAFDTFGNIYVVDGGHSNVQIFNREFQPLLFFGGYSRKIEYFDLPSGIAISKNNRIYICNEFFSRVNVYELINTSAKDSAPVPQPATPKPAETSPASPAATASAAPAAAPAAAPSTPAPAVAPGAPSADSTAAAPAPSPPSPTPSTAAPSATN